MSLFEELKRRNVFRVAVAYAVASWVLLQVADLVLEAIEAPGWVLKVLLLVVALGFVVALVVSWAYELTPEGIKREADVNREASIVTNTGRKLDRIIIVFLAFAVLLLLADRILRPPTETVAETSPGSPAVTGSAARPDPGTQSVGAKPETSIAVLPFVNLSTDIENEFFSDGIAEEILNVLASIPELKVAARTSAFAYKGSNINISRIAEELGVNHILEGSVRKAGNQVRVTAQLIQASDGFHLWSDNYDRELTNIFAIQDEIAGSIADALKLTLEIEAGASGNLTGTTSISAYEHYLRGMQLWHLRTVADLETAIEAFEAAIAIDPEFAKAHAGLALTWAVIYGYTDKYEAIALDQSIEAANRAIALDPANVEARAAKAVVFRSQGRFAESKALFDEVFELNPSYASARQWYGGLLGEMGDPVAGLAEYRKAWGLDPRSRIIGYNFTWRLWGLQQNREAWQVINEVLGFAPEFPDALDLAMIMSILEGRCDQAYEYAVRLSTVLNKPAGSAQPYRDLCLPEQRQQAVDTILTWDGYGFADPAEPALSYPVDLIIMFVEFGLFDEAWQVQAKSGQSALFNVTYMRNVRTQRGIEFQCSQRYRDQVAELGPAPALDPVDCSSVDTSP